MKKTQMLNVSKHQTPPNRSPQASSTKVSTKILSLHFTNPPQAKD